MKLTTLFHFNRNSKGFTVIETVVSLLLISIIGLGAAMANVQVLNQTSRNNDYTTADRQTLNAVHWISRDTHMAQIIDPTGPSGFPLTMTWIDWDNNQHRVIYDIDGDNKLRRSYSINSDTPLETLIAEYINDDTEMTNCVSDNGVLTLTVTTSMGEGANSINMTKIQEITSRPNL